MRSEGIFQLEARETSWYRQSYVFTTEKIERPSTEIRFFSHSLVLEKLDIAATGGLSTRLCSYAVAIAIMRISVEVGAC